MVLMVLAALAIVAWAAIACVLFYKIWHYLLHGTWNLLWGETVEEDVAVKPPFDIDAVFTFAGEAGADDNRTGDNDELKHSMRAVRLYLPWVRHIHVLMNERAVPSWMAADFEAKGIRLHGHASTFPAGSELPNTNSNAIETTLSQVPGVAEHALYFNDDVFINRPLPYTHFFTKEGSAVLVQYNGPVTQEHTQVVDGQDMLVPKLRAGFYQHVPYPFLTSEQKKFNARYAKYITWVRSHRVRDGLGDQPCTANSLVVPCMSFQNTLQLFRRTEAPMAMRPMTAPNSCSFAYVNHLCPQILDSILNPTAPLVVDAAVLATMKTAAATSYGEKVTYTINSSAVSAPVVDYFVVQDTALTPEERAAFKARLAAFFSAKYPKKAVFEI